MVYRKNEYSPTKVTVADKMYKLTEASRGRRKKEREQDLKLRVDNTLGIYPKVLGIIQKRAEQEHSFIKLDGLLSVLKIKESDLCMNTLRCLLIDDSFMVIVYKRAALRSIVKISWDKRIPVKKETKKWWRIFS